MWTQVATFITLACVLSNSIIPFQLRGYFQSSTIAGPYYMSGPGLSAFFCLFWFDSHNYFHKLGLYGGLNRWLFYSWVIAQSISWGSVVISWLFPGHGPRGLGEGLQAIEDEINGCYKKDDDEEVEEREEENDSTNATNLLFQCGIVGALINVPLMLTEELGWRGYLWDHLNDKLGFWSMNILIGFLWGIWHVPAVVTGWNYPGMPILGPILFTAHCMLQAPLFGFVRLKNGSVWGPCVLHGAINAIASLTVAAIQDHGKLWKGYVGVGGFLALALADLWLWIYICKVSEDFDPFGLAMEPTSVGPRLKFISLFETL